VALPLLLASTLTWSSAGVAAAAPQPGTLTTVSSGQNLSVGASAGLVPGGLQPVPGTGPVLNFVAVPDCRGLTQSGCEALLQSRGLQRGSLSFLTPATPPPYVGSVVVSQSPNAGLLVWRGSSVDITLQPLSVPWRP